MIPFTKINFGKEEKEAINKCIDSGWVVLGPKTKEFEEYLEKISDVKEYSGSPFKAASR